MPLAVRYIEPKHLWRKPLPNGVKNELHAVSVLSITGLIRQIGSLAKHAESVLGDICELLGQYNERTVELEKRYKSIKKNALAAMNTERDVQDGLSVAIATDHFESDHTIKQQLLSIDTAPEALIEQYQLSEKKPAIHLFTPYCDEGRNALDLYSNPNFFFDYWRAQIELEALKRLSSSGNFDITVTSIEEPDDPKPKKTSDSKTTSEISISATLPTRGKKMRRKNLHANKGIFHSYREKDQKRPTLTNDTFVPQEHSQSSGYISEYSSYNSLLDQEESTGTGQNHALYLSQASMLSAGGTINSTIPNGTLHQSHQSIKSTGSEDSRPKVLHKTRSSVGSRKDMSRKKSTPGSVSPIPIEDTDKDNKDSPKKFSLPTSLPIDLHTSPSTQRKGSLSSLTPTMVSPNASPAIRRRAENLANLLVSSPSRNSMTYPEVFSFPDPIEYPPFNKPARTLSSEPFHDQMKDVTIDDFPPQDQTLGLHNSTKQSSPNYINLSSPRVTPTHSPTVARRQSAAARPAPPRPDHPPKSHIKPNGSPPQNIKGSSSHNVPPPSPRAKLRKAPPPPSHPPKSRRDTKGEMDARPSLTTTTPPDTQTCTMQPLASNKTPPSLDSQTTPTNTPIQQNTVVPSNAQEVTKETSQTTQPSQVSPTSKVAPLKKQNSKDAVDAPLKKRTSREESHAVSIQSDANPPPSQRKSSQGSTSPHQKRHSRGESGNRRHSSKEKRNSRGEQHSDHPPLQKQTSKERRRSHSDSDKKERRKSQGEDGKKKKKTANSILKESGVPATITSQRSELLESIRHGIALKKVQQQAKKRTQSSSRMPWDVAAILERRTALMENSDNEEEGVVKDHEWDEN